MEWLSIVVGGGGLAFLLAFGKGLQWLVEGRQNRASKLFDELEEARDAAEARLAACREDTDHYINLANHWREARAAAVYEAKQAGVEITPVGPLPERPKRDIPEV